MKSGVKRYRVKLKFKGPVHFGYKEKTYNLTETFAHSDTLFSGIVNCYSLLYGKAAADNLVEKFFDNPPFKISSAFLYANGEFFVPRPLNMDLTPITGDYKKAKKVKYVPLDFILARDGGGKANKDYRVEHGILARKDMDTPYVISERPRVKINRGDFSTEIYYVSGCYFREGAGLWFFLDIYDDYEEEKVKAAIRLLGDEGIGGEKTYGFGSFEAGIEEYKEKKGNGSGDWLLLSLYYPRMDEKVADIIKAFSLLERAGYSYSPFNQQARKKKVRMLAEGSVFKKDVQGMVVDVSPGEDVGHKILKYGLAYTVPIFNRK
ncbi:type III-A CRISPR-associated RAMP protein Csm4 [Thermosediminibacter litoriperuensis]|uniref:CRISPR system Cms protein Csm4 n=1 Tax=Thermosediminibacter litoriperuensis TaxID=291989 RepID=A0A5S5ASK4_9FIRM|nr:type III-A CRISPR-associated RAMP protein Csm4 [Thermosediminibacter litoriperuensis]TYP55425.1 CRISPR-associated protein Csm4 [Thermosediminibacter litoriperuensis]